MRTVSFIIVLTLIVRGLFGQATPIIPFDEISTFSGPLMVTGPFEIFAPYQGMGPVVVYNTAQVDFVAGERVHLQPGFEAGNFSGNGYFHAQIGTAPDFEVVYLQPNEGSPQVGINEKLEIGMKLPTSLQATVQSFLVSGSGTNPFDPDQISVQADFVNGNEHFVGYGFYYQDYLRDPNTMGPAVTYNWIPQTTEFDWRIRFAPRTLGRWMGSISIFLAGNPVPLYKVEGLVFDCVPSSNPGFLQVGSDERHLKFSTSGESFFAIGQNIAWADGPWFRGQTISTSPYVRVGGILDISDWITSLADNRGNFVRFVVTPQFGEIAWGLVGNYSTTTSTTPALTNSSTGLAQAWELDQMLELCESRHVYLMFNVAFQGEYMINYTAPYGWENNPYNLGISGIDVPTDLYQNQIAYSEVRRRYNNKLRYYLSRIGYSTSLGVLQLFSEFENWSGNSAMNVNPSLRDDAFDFLRDLASDIKNNDGGANHLLTIAFGHEPWDYGNVNLHIFASQHVDITNFNRYPNERTAAYELFNAFNICTNCGPFNQSLFGSWGDKPALITETGLHEFGETTTILINGIPFTVPVVDVGDISSCSDITFHNYMWSSAFNGGYGVALNWWQWFNDDYRENNFPAIAEFFSTIDFEENSYVDPGRWDDGFVPAGNKMVETVYTKSESHDHAIGWAHNMSYWWGNVDQNCPDRYGFLIPITNADHDDGWNSPVSPPNLSAPMIEGLNYGRYSVQKYNTRSSGGPLGALDIEWTDIFGRLTLPALGPGEADYAFKVDRDPLFNLRLANSLTLDTLQMCTNDSLPAQGVFANTTPAFSYAWYVNNVFFSANVFPVFNFSESGNYDVKLVLSDSIETVLTMQQVIVVGYCDTSSSERISLSSSTLPISLPAPEFYPNPTNSFVTIQFDTCTTILGISVFDLAGSMVYCTISIQESRSNADLSNLPAGVFMVVVETSRGKFYKRISKID